MVPIRTASRALRSCFGRSVVRIPCVRPVTSARSFSSRSQDEQLTPDQADNIRKLVDEVTSNVEKGIEEMKASYGENHAEKRWQMEYYRERAHTYIVPAFSLMLSDPANTRKPSISAKNAIFLAHAFRDVPGDLVSRYTATMTMAKGSDIPFLLAVMRLSDTEPARAVYERLSLSIRKSQQSDLIEAGHQVASVPLLSVDKWTVPFEDPDFPKDWKKKTYPFEITPVFSQAKSMLEFHDWCLLGSATVLECLWGAFYATGEAKYILRILDIAQHFNAFMPDLPDALKSIISISDPLPDSMTAKGTTIEGSLRSVRAQVSRIAVWSLLSHTRMHPKVTEALASAMGNLSQFLVEPALRDPVKMATVSFTEAEALHRLETVTTVMTLAVQARINAPFETKSDASTLA